MIDPARFKLNRKDTLLLFIDVQEKLWNVMDQVAAAETQNQLRRWIEGAKVLGLPIVWTEQYVKGLGPTVGPLRELMPAGVTPFEKLTFSCVADEKIRAAVKGKGQVICVGIESHVCVFQTVRDLEAQGVRTFVPRDAVLSRSEQNRQAGLEAMHSAGATLGSTELFLFDLTGTAGTDEFKAISRLVK